MDAKTINLILSSIVPLVNNVMSWLADITAESKRTKEWTEEEKANNQALIDKLRLNPEEHEKVQPL